MWQRKVSIPYNEYSDRYWNYQGGVDFGYNTRRPLDYFNVIDGNRLTIGFKAFYDYRLNGLRYLNNCHVNAIADTGLTVSTARIINITHTTPANSLESATDWKVDLNKHYQFCFSNRELNHKNHLFAVIDSNNNTLISKDIGNIFTEKAGIRGTEFLQSGNGISVMVTDGTADTRLVQNITVPYSLDSAGWKQSCAGKEDSTFFTVSPINLVTQNFDAGAYTTDIIATEDLDVSQTPFTASSTTVCKTISTCSTFSIRGDTVACMGNTVWIKATKNNGCYKKIDWHFDTSAIQIGAITNDSVQVKFIKPGYTTLSASLYGCILADSLVIKVAAPALRFSIGEDITFCRNNDSVQLVLSDSLTNVRWSTGDTTHAITLRSAGKYWATVKDGCGNVWSDTLLVRQYLKPSAVALNSDTSICNGATFTSQASKDFQLYKWSTGQTTSSITISEAGKYYITAQDSCGNLSSDTIVATLLQPMPPVMLGNDTVTCNNANFQLVAPTGYKTYRWNNGATTNSIATAGPGTYYLSVTDSCDNQSSDTINIRLVANAINFPSDTSICRQDSIVLLQNEGFHTYL